MTAEAPKGPGRTRRRVVPTPRTEGVADPNEPQSPVRRSPVASPDEVIGSTAADVFLADRVGNRPDVQTLLRRLSQEDGQPDQS